MANPTAVSTPTDLIQQLMPLRNDPGKLHEALAKYDAALVGAAFAQLLALAAPDEENIERCRKLVSTL